MTFKVMLACAIFVASSGAVWSAQKADFNKASKEAAADYDSWTEEPSPSLIEERRRAALSRLHPDDHAAFHANAPAHPKARLKYYSGFAQR